METQVKQCVHFQKGFLGQIVFLTLCQTAKNLFGHSHIQRNLTLIKYMSATEDPHLYCKAT